jgi:hypothetical protein
MRIDSKAFSRSTARRNSRRGALAGTAALVIGLGLAVVCLTPDSPAAPAEPVLAAKVEKTIAAPVRVASIPRAPVQVAAAPAPQVTAQITVPAATQAQTRCADPAYVFLNPACQMAVKRHIYRHRRVVTFVAGNATAAPSVAAAATAPAAQNAPARQQAATRTRPTVATARPAPIDRPLPLVPTLKTAQRVTPAVATE